MQHPRTGAGGVVFALAAYGWWGLVPLYFKAVEGVPALEVLAHRILWCVVLLAGWLVLSGRTAGGARRLLGLRPGGLVLITTALIATNWFTFIWAVFAGRVLEASLGYFINPLVSVLLGRIFLGERLRRLQWAAVGLAAASVSFLTWRSGSPPWLALLLACSFGLYGLLRKRSALGAVDGLLLETLLLLPPALGYLAWGTWRGETVFLAAGAPMSLLLMAAGPVTAMPLIWFVAAAKRLRLATLGFLQYLAPSLQFSLAALAFGESVGPARLITFAGIWAALTLYSVETVRASRAAATRAA